MAKTYWMSACLLTLYAPALFEHVLQGLEAALTHTILALIRKPRRYVFAHPKNICGSYWRGIRHRTRRMRRHMLYKYIKTLCKLLSHVQCVQLHECCTTHFAPDHTDSEMNPEQNGQNQQSPRRHTKYAIHSTNPEPRKWTWIKKMNTIFQIHLRLTQ